MTSFDLKIDEDMDTKLAEVYLKKYGKVLHGEGFPDNGNIIYDSYQNKIFESKYKEMDAVYEDFNINAMKYLHLAMKIKENVNLFCQLEYLIRNIPIEDVKIFDLELIRHKLLYHGMYEEAESSFETKIVMSAHTPLVSLGCVAQTNAAEVVIVSGAQTAVVCRLFVDLCREVGLNFIKLCFLSNVNDFVLFNRKPESVPLVYLDNITKLKNGCAAVVTGKGEVDSAVDSFLFAPNRFPWQIKTIFVQENILECFKKSMDWKTVYNKNVTEFKYCSDVYSYEGKLFLYEYAGDPKNLGAVTLIEAYRTVKELLSLLKKLDPFCVSVWSTDVAESNQIAHEVDANIVWINSFGHFNNHKAAQAFFSIIHFESYYLKNKNILSDVTKDNLENIKELRKKLEEWCKYSKSMRHWKLFQVLQKIRPEWCKKIKSSDNSVDVDQEMCITIRKPIGLIFKDLLCVDEILEFIQYIVDGGAIYFRISQNESEYQKAVAYNTGVGAIAPLFIESTTEEIFYNVGQLHYTTKAIWTNIGTTFAN